MEGIRSKSINTRFQQRCSSRGLYMSEGKTGADLLASEVKLQT